MSQDLKEAALEYHAKPRPGKLSVEITKPTKTSRDLSLAYSPGVAEPVREIAKDPENAYKYTAKGNLVAVISNGTAVLGLGNIGALAGVKLVFPGAKLDGESLYELFEGEKVTISAGVPTVWLLVLQFLQQNNKKLSTLKRMTVGGSACPPALMKTFKQDYGVQLEHAWGMTEMSPLGTYNHPKAKHLGLSEEERFNVALSQGRAAAVLEAMAHGCVPILSDLPANRQWVDAAGGCLVPAGDVNALADNVAARLTAARREMIAAETEAKAAEVGLVEDALRGFAGRLAEGGTLLLDEISEMDARLQAKLLRALQSGELGDVLGLAPPPGLGTTAQ